MSVADSYMIDDDCPLRIYCFQDADGGGIEEMGNGHQRENGGFDDDGRRHE